MAVKAVFAIATMVAVAIALMLPVPHHADQPQHSQLPGIEIGQS
ncbi:MAG: hypothetical protein V4466_13840 [Pseudomonadota bacterium]